MNITRGYKRLLLIVAVLGLLLVLTAGALHAQEGEDSSANGTESQSIGDLVLIVGVAAVGFTGIVLWSREAGEDRADKS